ncbi:MAG TPA: ThuA domain-containing protein, partial [Candidatus Binatia bacterium]|nr:ThuA domain-containing protein [Candidatus Binatia bacterium]
MRLRLACALGVLAAALPVLGQKDTPLRVFIRASEKTHGPGEHDYPRFLREWTTLLNGRGAVATGALRFPTREELQKTDVLVIYAADGNNIAPPDRRNLQWFLKRGGGIVALHDAICGTNAAWFQTLVGGAKDHGVTNWSTGLMGLYFQDSSHPITQGIANYDLRDELFYRLHLMPGIKVLATTFHTAREILPQMWIYEKGKSRAFVSLQGHQYATFGLPQHRGLLLRGIAWAGKRNVDALTRNEELDSFRYPPGGPTRPEEASHKIHLSPEFDLS